MKIRQFIGNDFKETLALVKRELGPDAVIMSARTIKKGFGLMKDRVEITAALDYVQPPVSPQVRKKKAMTIAEGNAEIFELDDKGSFVNNLDEAINKGIDNNKIEAVLEEIRSLRGDLTPVLTGLEQKSLYPLVRSGIDRELAAQLVSRAGGSDKETLKKTISNDFKKADPPDSSKRVHIFAGPTGVGKTTTLAKIAADCVRKGNQVVITTFDLFRPGGEAQLRSYADKLGNGVFFKTLGSMGELFDLLTHTNDKIFIDTPGRSPGDKGFLDGLLSFQFTDMPINTYLLLSANTDPEANMSVYKKYEGLHMDSLIFTKVDEGVRFGSLYNLALASGKPVSHLTTGQNVPDDIMTPSNEELADLIMENSLFGGNQT